MFERPQQRGEDVLLVHVNFTESWGREDLSEFIALTLSAGANVANVITATRHAPDPKYFVGTGKAEEIKANAQQRKADCIIFNHALSPGQQRNLESFFQLRVLDRTQLILDIFAQRARTYEGKLQVELAQLQHMATRLVHGWTHLERQKGGIGLRGPGETQLETDRRLIRARIKTIRQRLEKVRQHRAQGRQKRQTKPVPVVSLVGYTNAGKSTLFNALTNADVYAANQLFATLDPTLRRINLPEVGEVVLVDTVGFIRHLPHDLVEAFRATLEEIREADLLLHVIDANDPHQADTIAAVETVLQEIDATSVPQIKVYNKIDLLPEFEPHLEKEAVFVSAQKDLGLDLLKKIIQEKLSTSMIEFTFVLSAQEGAMRSRLYAIDAIVNEQSTEEGGWQLHVRLPELVWRKFGYTQTA